MVTFSAVSCRRRPFVMDSLLTSTLLTVASSTVPFVWFRCDGFILDSYVLNGFSSTDNFLKV